MDGLKSGYRRAVFVWIAMVFSIFIYALVVELMRMNPALLKRPSLFPEIENLRYVFVFLAIAEFFLIGFIRNQILSASQAQKPAPHGNPLPATVSKLLNASVVTNALCESLAIYGLVLFFLTRNPFDFYIFLVLSLIYFLFYFPRYDQWEESFRGTEGKESLGIFARS